jgi:hypothetical protein
MNNLKEILACRNELAAKTKVASMSDPTATMEVVVPPAPRPTNDEDTRRVETS